ERRAHQRVEVAGLGPRLDAPPTVTTQRLGFGVGQLVVDVADRAHDPPLTSRAATRAASLSTVSASAHTSASVSPNDLPTEAPLNSRPSIDWASAAASPRIIW